MIFRIERKLLYYVSGQIFKKGTHTHTAHNLWHVLACKYFRSDRLFLFLSLWHFKIKWKRHQYNICINTKMLLWYFGKREKQASKKKLRDERKVRGKQVESRRFEKLYLNTVNYFALKRPTSFTLVSNVTSCANGQGHNFLFC